MRVNNRYDSAGTDLARELEARQQGVSRPNGVQTVGLMLLGSTDLQLVALYLDRIVPPRRRRLLPILGRAKQGTAIASPHLPERCSGPASESRLSQQTGSATLSVRMS